MSEWHFFSTADADILSVLVSYYYKLKKENKNKDKIFPQPELFHLDTQRGQWRDSATKIKTYHAQQGGLQRSWGKFVKISLFISFSFAFRSLWGWGDCCVKLVL